LTQRFLMQVEFLALNVLKGLCCHIVSVASWSCCSCVVGSSGVVVVSFLCCVVFALCRFCACQQGGLGQVRDGGAYVVSQNR
jgi:hypothetical protein